MEIVVGGYECLIDELIYSLERSSGDRSGLRTRDSFCG